jgi:hypothetical protein
MLFQIAEQQPRSKAVRNRSASRRRRRLKVVINRKMKNKS